ncbi:hypothetical protein [Phocaeicola dorei]|uniref:hypothetical protein n=1 Tax=Phocaeicola dorei TaxID=357276 RepID=UPI0016237C21|nr:hypothetical protein [Phocaeicola dorei]
MGKPEKRSSKRGAGLQWSSSGASALPKQPPSSRIAVPSFYRLSRQSVANPFPPATCDREIGIRFAGKTVWFVLLSVLPFSLFSASPNVRFS